MKTHGTNIENQEEKKILSSFCVSSSSGQSLFSVGTTNYYQIDPWSEPVEISHEILNDSIEFIYKQTKISWNYASQEERVFKVIYSCVDGKWNKSERLYGEIIAATEEQYEFEK